MRIVVGKGSCGLAAGAEKVYNAIVESLGKKGSSIEVGTVGCVGMCWLEPIVDIYGDNNELTRLVKVKPTDAEAISVALTGDISAVDHLKINESDAEFLSKQTRIALRNCGIIDPESIDAYIEKGGYIQAWGNVGSQPRLIIDCMNNIPLLFWAAKETGDSNYYEKACNHAKTTINNIVRKDASTHHTFYFNPDGTPDRGVTHQGRGDDSCWARGQAWIISGLPISYRYTGHSDIPELFEKVTNYFLNRLPMDYVPFWDLDFKDGDDEPRDSSSAAIASCGILEMLPFIKDENSKKIYEGAVNEMMYSLYENYSTKNNPQSNALLMHSTYSIPHNLGVDECNIWGCYYYLEALARMYKAIKPYW